MRVPVLKAVFPLSAQKRMRSCVWAREGAGDGFALHALHRHFLLISISVQRFACLGASARRACLVRLAHHIKKSLYLS